MINDSFLEEIGLTKGESKVYLALLKTGETTTGKIVDEANISSGKIYEILDRLTKKGMVNSIIREKTKHFSAASPVNLRIYLEQRSAELQHHKDALEEQLPQLMLLQQLVKKKYETKLYKGYAGIRAAAYDVLQELSRGDELFIMGVKLSRDRKYNLFWKQWHDERIKRGVNAKIIFSENDKEYFEVFSKMKLTEARYLAGNTPSSIGISKDRILLSTYAEEPTAISILHPEIALSFTTLFHQQWKGAKR